jgi:hypothetical protein
LEEEEVDDDDEEETQPLQANTRNTRNAASRRIGGTNQNNECQDQRKCQ